MVQQLDHRLLNIPNPSVNPSNSKNNINGVKSTCIKNNFADKKYQNFHHKLFSETTKNKIKRKASDGMIMRNTDRMPNNNTTKNKRIPTKSTTYGNQTHSERMKKKAPSRPNNQSNGYQKSDDSCFKSYNISKRFKHNDKNKSEMQFPKYALDYRYCQHFPRNYEYYHYSISNSANKSTAQPKAGNPKTKYELLSNTDLGLSSTLEFDDPFFSHYSHFSVNSIFANNSKKFIKPNYETIYQLNEIELRGLKYLNEISQEEPIDLKLSAPIKLHIDAYFNSTIEYGCFEELRTKVKKISKE